MRVNWNETMSYECNYQFLFFKLFLTVMQLEIVCLVHKMNSYQYITITNKVSFSQIEVFDLNKLTMVLN